MRRQVERKLTLPAYSITTSQLEILIDRLRLLFDTPNEVNCSIHIPLKSEYLSFGNVEELKSYSPLKGRITKFTVYLGQATRQIYISADYFLLDSRTTIKAEGENEAWCAGVIDTIQTFIQPHKRWYNWFVAAPIGWLVMAIIYIPFIGSLFMPKGYMVDKSFAASWMVIAVTLSFLWWRKGKLLPASTLIVTEEEKFFRRYGTELSLLLALVSVVVAVIGLFR